MFVVWRAYNSQKVGGEDLMGRNVVVFKSVVILQLLENYFGAETYWSTQLELQFTEDRVAQLRNHQSQSWEAGHVMVVDGQSLDANMPTVHEK